MRHSLISAIAPTEHIVVAEIEELFNRELAAWVAANNRGWCGTAAELITALSIRPKLGNALRLWSATAVCTHLEFHRQVLYSLGVIVVLHDRVPRMVSLQPRDGRHGNKSAVSTRSLTETYDRGTSVSTGADEDKVDATDPRDLAVGNNPISQASCTNGSISPLGTPNPDYKGEALFENRGEVLFAIATLDARIRGQNVRVDAALELLVNRTGELTRSVGTAVVFWRVDKNRVLYAVRSGMNVEMEGLHVASRSAVENGRILQLREAEKHPIVGAQCRREGIKSLIVIPAFCDRQVVGTLELLFKQTRSFTNADVLALELIARVVISCMSHPGRNASSAEEPNLRNLFRKVNRGQ